MRFPSLLLKECLLEDLYDKKKEADSLTTGLRARNFYRRVISCLEVDLQMPVSAAYQWTEERSPNHHPRIITPKWPVGLIRTNPVVPARRASEIINYSEFRPVNFEIYLAANTSGGVVEGETERYQYSLESNGQFLGSYRDVEDKIKEMFYKNDENSDFHLVNRQVADYTLLLGVDPVSQGKIFIQMGNDLKVKKRRLFSKER